MNFSVFLNTNTLTLHRFSLSILCKVCNFTESKSYLFTATSCNKMASRQIADLNFPSKTWRMLFITPGSTHLPLYVKVNVQVSLRKMAKCLTSTQVPRWKLAKSQPPLTFHSIEWLSPQLLLMFHKQLWRVSRTWSGTSMEAAGSMEVLQNFCGTSADLCRTSTGHFCLGTEKVWDMYLYWQSEWQTPQVPDCLRNQRHHT